MANCQLSVAHRNNITNFSSVGKFVAGQLQFGWSSVRIFRGLAILKPSVNAFSSGIPSSFKDSNSEILWLKDQKGEG